MSVYPHTCSPIRKLFLDKWKYQLVGMYRDGDDLNTSCENLNQIMINAVNPIPGERVLYFSCGYGENSTVCAEQTGASVDHIYKNTWRILRARDLNPSTQVNYFKSYLSELPSNTYDCVIINETISDFTNELEQTHRILKRGGRLALAPLTTRNIDVHIKRLVGDYKFEAPEYVVEEFEKLFETNQITEFNQSCYNTYDELANIFSSDTSDLAPCYQANLKICHNNFRARCNFVSEGLWGKMLLTGVKK